jgi:hypothetical protein
VYPMLPVSLDCLRLVYPMLSVSLDCLFLITLSVFSIIYIRSTQNIFLSADLLKNIETLPDFQNLLYRHLFTSLCSYYFIDTSEHCSRHPRYIYFTLNVLTEILLQANGSETLVLVLHFHWMISKNKCEICNQVLWPYLVSNNKTGAYEAEQQVDDVSVSGSVNLPWNKTKAYNSYC